MTSSSGICLHVSRNLTSFFFEFMQARAKSEKDRIKSID
jgi:hypothetical protein